MEPESQATDKEWEQSDLSSYCMQYHKASKMYQQISEQITIVVMAGKGLICISVSEDFFI